MGQYYPARCLCPQKVPQVDYRVRSSAASTIRAPGGPVQPHPQVGPGICRECKETSFLSDSRPWEPSPPVPSQAILPWDQEDIRSRSISSVARDLRSIG